MRRLFPNFVRRTCRTPSGGHRPGGGRAPPRPGGPSRRWSPTAVAYTWRRADRWSGGGRPPRRAPEFLGRIDVGQPAALRGREQGGRGISWTGSSAWTKRARRRISPSRTCRAAGEGASAAQATRRGGTDMGVAPRRGKPDEGVEAVRDPVQPKAEGPSEREVVFHLGRQHPAPPGHGWAISRRRASPPWRSGASSAASGGAAPRRSRPGTRPGGAWRSRPSAAGHGRHARASPPRPGRGPSPRWR